MHTPTLTADDLAYLASLPSSEFQKLLTHISRNDERIAAQLLRDVESHRYLTNEKREVADFFDVKPETITLWQQKGMPYQAGGHGVKGWYDLRSCSRWLAEQRAGVSLDDIEAAGITAGYREEKRRITELQRKKLEGELVPASEYRERLMRCLVAIRKGVEQFHRSFGNDAVEMLNSLIDEAEATLFIDDA